MKPRTLLIGLAVLLCAVALALRPATTSTAAKRATPNTEGAKVAAASGLQDVTLTSNGPSGYKGTGVDGAHRPVGIEVTREGKQLRWRTTMTTSDGRVLETGGGVLH